MTCASYYPNVDLKLRGMMADAALQDSIESITIEEDLMAPSMFTIGLYNLQGNHRSTHRPSEWLSGGALDIGNEVVVSMGQRDRTTPMMQGEITGLEPTFMEDSIPSMIVRGYDHGHRLLRSHKTRTFRQMTASDIAKQIAREAGLGQQVTNSQVTRAYVMQHNQTDWAFLQELAREIGYELFVRNKVLYFRSPRIDLQPVTILRIGVDVREFYPRLSTMGQARSITFRGWDMERKAAFIAQARLGDELAKMGTEHTGPEVAGKAFGRDGLANVDLPVGSQAEAEQLARGRYNDMALEYITGECICDGNTEIRIGVVVEIQGADKRFDGPYYVTAATHSLDSSREYRTEFSFRRNGA